MFRCISLVVCNNVFLHVHAIKIDRVTVRARCRRPSAVFKFFEPEVRDGSRRNEMVMSRLLQGRKDKCALPTFLGTRGCWEINIQWRAQRQSECTYASLALPVHTRFPTHPCARSWPTTYTRG
ncbi:hypothetical protein BV25DRAFT_222841 [Artomyces pyxidatus]|uniref:Uncharacterized protein n=1 Tax=Artomyces pyxidatus TaxID=48021 RepID=A0ACB8T864_9AGAM|nr:hypothetical protein BV25DRAFT_222841 [Artomyces pyxidatus]